MDNVRYLNVKQFESLSRSTSGRTSPVSNWSFASDERSDTASTMSYESKNLTSFIGYYGKALFIYYLRKMSRKTNISYPEIRTRTCTCQG